MAVSDVNMSSEGSGSSSRLRQFGLYKTIDSRTAEFLKLSRKRQIRRGCACAAVSTAITVTVVVSALLVYEYGFHTDSKMAPSTLRKFNWFNAVNDSDVTFDKNKETLANNKNNNKLLPIILKALDQKRYLETIIEEQSTPPYERTTDYPLEKNVFTDSRNWKMPQLKINEMGYKAPLQSFFRPKYEDSFTKTRKLIDYQRIMTYLNALSLNTKVDETNQNHFSTTGKPYDSTRSYKNEILHQYNYHKIEPETKKAETTETIKNPGQSNIMSIESDKKYCKCPNHSNLADILQKLYTSIQQLRPRIIEITTNITEACNRHRPDNYTTIIVHQPHNASNQRNPISIRNLKYTTTMPTKHKKISFFRISNKTMTFKLETATLVAQNVLTSTERANNLTNKQNLMSIIQNDYYAMPQKDRANRFKEQAMPWKLDFGIKASEVTTTVYTHTKKITTTPTSTEKTRNIKEKESITTEKEAHQGFDDEEHDFTDEIDQLQPDSHQHQQYLNSQSAHTDKGKPKVFEEYNYLANYMDGLSKLYSKPFIFDKPQAVPAVESSTVRAFDLKQFFSYETIDPLVKLEKTTTGSPRTIKPIQWFSVKQNMSTSKFPPSQPKETSNKNRKKGSLSMPRTAKPYFGSKLEEATEVNKQPHGNVLLPMIQSYLLSKQGNGILNLNFETTTSVNVVSARDSEELPFDLRFFANEESDHIYTNILSNSHTTTPITFVQQLNKGKSQLKKDITTGLTLVKAIKNKTRSKKKKLPKAQTWTPPIIRHLKSNAPVKAEPKNYKIKEIFYMTGSENPVDDFEANLHELMYFDRSPINYTALTSSFLNKTDSGSIELTKSMMPETRPSYLEIKRNHELDLYYDERKP